jgi:hypothetical protein
LYSRTNEVGAKYSGFIKAIQKKDKAATALHSEGFLYRKSKQEVYQRIYPNAQSLRTYPYPSGKSV